MTESRGIHRWLVFISACVVMVVPMGFMYSLGALFTQFLTVFNVPRTEASLVQSVAFVVGLASGCLHGIVMHKFGMAVTGIIGSSLATAGLAISFFARSISYLVISIGIVNAWGSITLYIVCSAAVGHHFSGNLAIILLSIVNACSGVGGMIFPFILTYLSDTFGLRGTFLVTAGLVMNTIPGALLWTKVRKHESPNSSTPEAKENNQIKSKNKYITNDDFRTVQKGLKSNKERGATQMIKVVFQDQFSQINESEDNTDTTICNSIKQLVKNKCYILLIIGLAFSYPSIMVLLTFIADTYLDSGLSTNDANVGFLLLNACGIIGRLLPGLMMQLSWITALKIPIVASLITALAMTGVVMSDTLSLKLVFTSLAGIAYGMFVSCFSVTIVDVVGSKHFGNAIGLAFTLNGLANVAAGPVSGFLRDATGSYLAVFLVASGVQFLAICFYCVADIYQRKKRCQRRRTSVFYLTNF